MKYQIMLGILFTLLAKRKVSAAELAHKYECSTRSIYRYVEELIVAGIPIDITRGANGGISIADTFKLPKGFLTRDEYARTLEAMLAMVEQTGDKVLEEAVAKISAQMKTEKYDSAITGNIMVDSGTWGVEKRFSEKLRLVERAIEEQEVLEIDYSARGGERTTRCIHPHLLIYKQKIWYLYAHCEARGDFRTFKLGRMRSITKTGRTFEKREFSRDDIPLSFWDLNVIEAKFEIAPEAFFFAEEWLGVDSVFEENGKFYAEVQLPDDEYLVGMILSAGAGFKVLSPESLRERVLREAEKIVNN